MDKNSFIQAAHSGKGRFRVEDIKIITGDKDLLGKGFLEIDPSDFKLIVILEADDGHNHIPEGYRTQNQYWHITGVIEDEIQFKIRDLPSGSSFHSGMGVPTRSVLEFSTSHMELLAIGLDGMTHQQTYDLQQAAMKHLPIAPVFKNPGSSPQPNATHNVQVEFKGVLRDFKLIEHNANTEIITKNPFFDDRSTFKRNVFHGEFAEWKYGLIENGDDLEIYFNSKPEYISQGEEHDKRLWQAFLQSIAFTHGRHPWPFLLQYRRDGKLVSEIIHLYKALASSPHYPFTKRLAFNNAAKKLEWKYEKALDLAFAFFAADTKLSQEIANLHYIFREASKGGTAKKVSLLSLCSLFESLVRVIYEEKIASTKKVEFDDFQKAKDEVYNQLSKREENTYKRLAGLVKTAEPINNRSRYEAVIQHLDLKPEATWLEIFVLWQKSRNPVSHRMSNVGASDESIKEELFAESRIAGAINCFVLKLMSYRGYVRLSTYDDKYGQI